MPLTLGSRLGPYEIIAAIGAGGMGEVYRARDTKLDREVALKILPDSFAADPDRLARFTREAKTLASLNHPNIASIYGVEGVALVMELVEGDDLSAIIAAGGIPLAESIAIARQIIDALEAAHDIGIVHRDLKPANIKVRHDGTVKVLDFGLARTQDSGQGAQDSLSLINSPTMTSPATAMGMILGTAPYMSPEQARGRPVDKRTDVWAFGCVLYEMLTGTKTFDGEDATEIISAIVKSEPDWNALPASLPAHIRTIVTRCLVKDRKARIPDLSVVRYMLDHPHVSAESTTSALASARGSNRIWQAAAALFLVTTIACGWAWYRGSAVETAVSRFEIPPPDGMVFVGGSRLGSTVPVISPDGRTVAFTARRLEGQRSLYVRPIDSLVAQPLPGTDGATFPFWSPDSQSIGYAVTGKLMKVAATGGPSQTLCPLNPGIVSRGGSWSAEGVIIFNNGPAPSPLHRVPAAGAAACMPMGKVAEGQTGRQFPAFLPDGRHFLFHASGSEEAGGVFVGSIDSDETTRVLSSDTGAIYDKQGGHLLFVRQGTLLAQLFDPETFSLTGDPFPIAERIEAAAVQGVVAFSLSDTGTLAYGNGLATDAGVVLTWVDRQGKTIGTVGPPAVYRGVSLSPDDSHVAAHRHDGDGGDVWLTDVTQNLPSRFTLDAKQENQAPVWSPGSDRIAFGSLRGGKPGIYIRAANRTGADERVFETTSSRSVLPMSWSRDGKTLLFQVFEAKTTRDLWMLSLEGERKAWPLLQSESSEQLGQLSPDSRWLAYVSDETGTSELYVKSATANGGLWPISTGGGGSGRWRADGKELFFASRGKIRAAEVTTRGDAFVVGTQRELFDHTGYPSHNDSYFPWAVTGDGERFLMPRRIAETESEITSNPIVIVINWLSGIRK